MKNYENWHFDNEPNCIWIVLKTRNNDHLRSELFYAVLEEWIFENFRGPIYDDDIYRDNLHLWWNEKIKIKARDPRLMLLTF